MTRVTVNDTLRNALRNFSGPVELCDESGKVVARVFPVLDLSNYEPWEPPISEEELQRREQSGEKRYTTAEVLAYLEKL
jgi:hypothetical protein